MKKGFYKRSLAAVLIAVMSVGLAACGDKGSSNNESQTQEESAEVKTTQEAIGPDTVMMKVEDTEVPAYEVFYFYASAKNYYEQSGYVTDWTQDYTQDMTLGDYLKTITEEQVLELNYYLLNADKYGVELTDEDKENAKTSAQQYLDSLDSDTIDFYGFNLENLTDIAEKYTIANGVYKKLIEEKEGEMTDEDKASCQYRKVQHILISTMDGPASKTSESDGSDAETKDSEALDLEEQAYKEEQYAQAEEVLAKAKAGEDFEELAKEYTADSGVEYSINDAGQTIDGATMVTEFTEAAVALKDGEISDIVETQFGYHIIKCVTTNDEETTQQAIEQFAAQKASEDYQTWYNTTPYEYMDVWKDYVVTNPVADDTTESESADATADATVTESADVTATEDTDAQDDKTAADDAATADTGTDNTDADTQQ